MGSVFIYGACVGCVGQLGSFGLPAVLRRGVLPSSASFLRTAVSVQCSRCRVDPRLDASSVCGIGGRGARSGAPLACGSGEGGGTFSLRRPPSASWRRR